MGFKVEIENVRLSEIVPLIIGITVLTIIIPITILEMQMRELDQKMAHYTQWTKEQETINNKIMLSHRHKHKSGDAYIPYSMP